MHNADVFGRDFVSQFRDFLILIAVTVNELNYCVRNGNRCTLVTINTYYFVAHSCAALLLYHTISLLSTSFLKKFGDPWENRTPDAGVRGRSLNRLTNGP